MMKRAQKAFLSILLSAALLAGCASGAESGASQPEESSAEASEGLFDGEEEGGEDGADTGIPGVGSEENTEETQPGLPEEQKEREWTEEDYSRAMAKRNQEYDAANTVITSEEGISPADPKEYTLLIYMVGSDLESRGGKGSRDMKEIEEAGIDYSRTNVVIYTGGTRKWTADIPCDTNCVVDMSREAGQRVTARTPANADMGAPETLTAFLNYADEYYPAEHTSLIFWDHGGGPLDGYGVDELFNADSLLSGEMDRALAASAFSKKKLDFVGFDACLMGSLETMRIFSQYADYYIGSEEYEPGDGWDYTCLSVLNETRDPKAVAEAVVEAYSRYYENLRTGTSDPDVTLSAADLSKAEAVARDLEALAKSLSAALGRGSYPRLQQLRKDVKSFGLVRDAGGGTSRSFDLVDLAHFAEAVKEVDAAAAEKLLADLGEMVFVNASNIEHCSGVTVFYPFLNKNQYRAGAEIYEEASASGAYTALLDELSRRWGSEEKRDWRFGELKQNGAFYNLTFTAEQQEKTAAVYYSVLLEGTDGAYVPALSRVRVETAADGTVQIPADPEVILAWSESGGETIWNGAEIEHGEMRDVFRLGTSYLISNPNYITEPTAAETLETAVTLKKDRATDEVAIASITTAQEELSTDGKATVDILGWEALYTSVNYAAPERDSQGRMKPSAEWNPTGSRMLCMLPIGENFGFRMQPVSKSKGNFLLLAEIEDIDGNFYASEPVLLSGNTDARTEIISTEQGTITAAVYADHAVITDYNGRDKRVVIPWEIGGVPVTEIGDGAFSYYSVFDANGWTPLEEAVIPETVTRIAHSAFEHCLDLKKVDLPAGLTDIGSFAFGDCRELKKLTLPETLKALGSGALSGTALTEIRLPAGLARIGTGVFYGCESLASITMDGASSACAVKDGLLLSGDGKTLLACPGTGVETLTVPDGIETIAFGACARSQICEVRLPEGLRVIANNAFYACPELSAPAFPDSLVRIGSYAFGAPLLEISYDVMEREQQQIALGKALSEIGEGAFDLFPVRSFAVDPENEIFLTKDGSLMNRAGDAVLAIAMDTGSVAYLPEGTHAFDEELFDLYSQFDVFSEDEVRSYRLQLVLPDSVTSFPDEPAATASDDYYFHCSPGSAAEQFAKENGIPFDSCMDPHYREVTVEDENGRSVYLIYPDRAAFVEYEGSCETLAVPAEIEGVPVTVLGDGEHPVFELFGDTSVGTLVLPDSIREIRAHALEYMYTVESFELPDSVEIIGESGLDPDGLKALPAHLQYLARYALAGSMEGTVTLPASLTDFADGAFAYLDGVDAYEVAEGNPSFRAQNGMVLSADGTRLLAAPGSERTVELTVPEGVTEIAPYALSNRNWVERIHFPKSLTVIRPYGVFDCISLQEVTFEEGLELIEESAFDDCYSLQKVHFPKSLTGIRDRAFYMCSELTEVSFEEGLTSIGESAFSEAGKLKALSLPESLVSVGEDAFSCRMDTGEKPVKKTVSIGKNLVEIGSGAFNLPGNERFLIDAANPVFTEKDGMITDKAGTVLLACPTARTGRVAVPDGISRIGNCAFCCVTGMTDLVIPDSVTSIGDFLLPEWEYGEESGPNADFDSPVTVHCGKGSTAESYCRRHNLRCVTDGN